MIVWSLATWTKTNHCLSDLVGDPGCSKRIRPIQWRLCWFLSHRSVSHVKPSMTRNKTWMLNEAKRLDTSDVSRLFQITWFCSHRSFLVVADDESIPSKCTVLFFNRAQKPLNQMDHDDLERTVNIVAHLVRLWQRILVSFFYSISSVNHNPTSIRHQTTLVHRTVLSVISLISILGIPFTLSTEWSVCFESNSMMTVFLQNTESYSLQIEERKPLPPSIPYGGRIRSMLQMPQSICTAHPTPAEIRQCSVERYLHTTRVDVTSVPKNHHAPIISWFGLERLLSVQGRRTTS